MSFLPLFFREVVKIRSSKFNVNKDKDKRTYNNIVFDSKMEMMFYRDIVIPMYNRGKIKYYELQKKYILQPKFSKEGKTILPIVYVADFYLEYTDGKIEVIDVKGCADSVAKIKRKLFWYVYPNLTYRWVTHVQKYGGWCDYDYVQQQRLKNRKNKSRIKGE